MYNLPFEIKKIIKISLLIDILTSIIILLIKPRLVLTFNLGYIFSILSLLKSNYFITSLLYKVNIGAVKVMIMNNIFSLVLFIIVLVPSFMIGIVEGIFCVLGLLIIKITIYLSYGIKKKGGDDK